MKGINMIKSSIRIIQLSDMHLFANPEDSLVGVNTYKSFKKIVDQIHKTGKVDIILLSGDLAQDGSAEAYKHLAVLLNKLNAPTYYVPGNHDNLALMMQVYPLKHISNQRHIVLKNWQIILLDSQKPGAISGYLNQSQLEFLQQCLQKHPKHRAILLFHHQPIPVGSRWIDQLGLKNADDLWKMIAKNPIVHTILFGHVHQEFAQTVKGVECFATPSTCIQFKRHHDEFALDNLPPGYRWVNLYQDGHLETAVERLPKYVGIFMPDAKGY